MWALAAAALWRTKVPADLPLPSLDPSSVFGVHATRAGVRYERFFDYDWLLGTLAEISALVVLVRRGPRLARSLVFATHPPVRRPGQQSRRRRSDADRY